MGECGGWDRTFCLSKNSFGLQIQIDHSCDHSAFPFRDINEAFIFDNAFCKKVVEANQQKLGVHHLRLFGLSTHSRNCASWECKFFNGIKVCLLLNFLMSTVHH